MVWNYSKITSIKYFVFISVSKKIRKYIRRENSTTKIDWKLF